MRAIIQRVSEASVSVKTMGVCESIGPGFAVLLGIGKSDTTEGCEYIARKLVGLRVFEDSDDKMNLSLSDIDGEVLLVSQFTLYGDCRKGRRPSFTAAGRPETAEKLYEHTAGLIRKKGITVKSGMFRQKMQVKIINEGPVTLLLDSEKKF